ncbi:hypothetical protein CNY89_23190, partial [Amaricoccus sp. HAR-UPW-R2A-40]
MEAARTPFNAALDRVVVAVDPPVTTGAEADECGHDLDQALPAGDQPGGDAGHGGPSCGRAGLGLAANKMHLARSFLETVTRAYEGTRLGRQELDGEM